MEIKRSGVQPSNRGPADWFTGTVRVDPLFQAREPARTSGASVTFEPGARSIGTPIRSARSCSSPAVAAGCNAGAVRSRRFARAT
jgi:hypothetical protein